MTGEICYFPEGRHVRASSQAGRGTSDGHGVSAGHCSENQTITSSYFRAVKVRESSLLKKRQSPAANRPMVARLTDRAAAYAEAQAKRFDRSSDSMESETSRNIPTYQDHFMGNIRLADKPAKSDKSAMPTVDQVRIKIQEVLDEAHKGPVTVARELGFPRDYLRDF